MRVSRCALLFLVLVLLLCASPVVAQNCVPVSWPDARPVWSMCFIPPNLSSGPDGSGLELHDVQYKGQEVLYKANIPVLNVLYLPGGCGGTYLSFRDWASELWPFQADNVVSPGIAEPSTPPLTVCDHPGSDSGSFSGVAIQKGTDSLTLTTQMAAGWYRYIQKWIFYPDGSFSPQFAFTAIDAACIYHVHTHHVYWRLNFDIDDYGSDVVERGPTSISDPCCWTPITKETADKRATPFSNTPLWRVRSKATNRGYVIVDNPADGVADGWGDKDRWVLAYHQDEQDDGGATSGKKGDAIHIDPFLNGENVNGADIVVWYHAQHQHKSPVACISVGPTLVPFGSW